MKKALQKVIILAVIFLLSIAGIILYTVLRNRKTVTYEAMSGATLPIITMSWNGQAWNELHGYTTQMDLLKMRDTITPLTSDRHVGVTIQTFQTNVSQISYAVRSIDGTDLIEDTVVDGWSVQEGQIVLDLQLSNLLKAETEYCLTISLQTEQHPRVDYYTRVLYGSAMHTETLVTFARSFSEATFHPADARKLIPQYLQPNDSMSTTDYSYVNIHSRYAMLIWGNLNPQLIGERQMKMTELTPTQISVTFTYEVLAPNGLGESVTYRVEEVLCVRVRNEQLYLLDYARSMNRVISSAEIKLQKGILDLGVMDEGRESVQVANTTGTKEATKTVFVIGTSLYAYDAEKNSLQTIFSFSEMDGSDARLACQEHAVQLISSSEDGTVYFIVYGYMNAGIHEGAVGISFYRYAAETNTTDEMFYVPVDVSFQQLRQDMGSLAYVSSGNMFYFLLGRGIYAIDVASGECIQIAGDMMPGTYRLSSDHSMIAWQEGAEIATSTSIRCLDMETGLIQEVTAGEGEYLRLEGFLSRDLVYGVGRVSDIQTSAGITVGYPLYRLLICDEHLTEQMHYEVADIYINEVTMETSRLVMTRLQRQSDGSLAAASDDILMRNVEIAQAPVSNVQYRTTESCGLEYYVQLESEGDLVPVDDRQTVTYRDYRECRIVSLEQQASQTARYYVYTRGHLKTITASLREAIAAAYDEMGTVVDEIQTTVWNRDSRALYKTLTLPAKTPTGASSLQTCLELMLEMAGSSYDGVAGQLAAGDSPYTVLEDLGRGRVADLYGCELSYVLYDINAGFPVLLVTGDDTGLLLIGYETASLTFYDPASGQTTKLTMEEAQQQFAAYGNAFLSLRN